MKPPHAAASSRPTVDYPEPPTSGELPIELPAGSRWGVCLSHDIDHLGLREHLVDGFLLRYGFNIARQNLLRRWRPGRAVGAWWGIARAALGHDPWDVLEELLEAEARAGVKSTWFIAVRSGLGINYRPPAIQRAVDRLRAAGQEVGLHGQCSGDAVGLAEEVRELAAICGAPVRGLRMHYLRLSREVLDGMQAAGLEYDSTVMNRGNLDPDQHPLPGPRRLREGLLEIPLHVMDSTLFSVTGLGLDLAGARDYVRRLGDRAAELGRVVTVNLHPNSYSSQDPEMKQWYDILLSELTARSDVWLTDFRGLVERIQR